MRIVVNDYLGHAPQVQLSRALAARGHDVLHMYSGDVQSPKADLVRRSDDPPTLRIEGVHVGTRRSGSFLARRLHERRIGRAIAKRLSSFRPDVVIAGNNPLDTQREVQGACHRSGVVFIYWLQDFYAAQLDIEIEAHGKIFDVAVGSYYHWLEQKLLRRSNAVVAVADDYLGILAQAWEVYDRQCTVIRNWAPLDAVIPGAKANEWSERHGFADKKVILYAGSLGPMESPMQLPALARALRARHDVRIVVVSEGEGARQVAEEVRQQGLDNLVMLPYQPYEDYGRVLASADVLLGFVGSQAGVLFVPSKVPSYLCAGRPVVLAAPWQNGAARAVTDSSGGSVVPPDDPDALSKALLRYLDDDAVRTEDGQRARGYAEKAYDIAAITDRFERLFERLHTGPPRRRQSQAVVGENRPADEPPSHWDRSTA